MTKKEKVVKRDDGVNGLYSKETLDNGSTIELLSRRNPNESITYTERSITPQDTSYYIYNSTTPDMDRHVIGRKYVTPTKYNKMGWLGKRIIAGVRPDSWDAKFDSYQEPVDSFQPGGSIASRLWNKWTGKDTYTDGYGTTRSHVPVRESAHRTIVKAANSPLVQAIPVVGDIADGYVAADYAAKGDYKPAIAAIGAGLVLPNVAEMGARFIPKQTWESALKKINDIDLEKTFKYEMSDETKKLFDDIKSGKKKLTKDMNDLTDNEKEQLLEVLASSSLNRKGVGKGRIPSDTYHNFGPNDLDIDKVWLPEDPNVIGRADVGNVAASQSVEPWWGWDPVEYQKGGEIPANDQQQQLFISIITDMANVLGVEPSQELAEAVMTAFENNDDSQGLITLFTQIKDKHMNETGLFREGGKMIAFIEKFGCGGKSPKKKTSKKQEGGEVENSGAGYITTPVNDIKARREWRQRTGGSRADARRTQRILAANIENKGGISRGSARNSAAAMMMDPQRFAAPSERPALDPANQTQLNVASPALNPVQALGPSRPAPAVSTPASTPMGPIDRIQGRVNNAIDGYQRGTDRIIDGIQAGGNRVYDAVQDGARRIGDGIQTGGNAIVDGMQGVSRRAGDWVQNAGNKVFDGIQSASNVFGIRPEFVDRAIDDVQAGVNRAYDNAQDFGARVVDGIQSGANRAYDAVQDGARRIGDGVQNVGNRIIDGGQRVRNAVIDGTQNFGNRVVDGVQAGAQRLGQGIQRAGQRISEWFR